MITRISISEKTRKKLKEYGDKEESYDEILNGLLNIAYKKQVQDLLLDSRGCITVEEAIRRAKEKWG